MFTARRRSSCLGSLITDAFSIHASNIERSELVHQQPAENDHAGRSLQPVPMDETIKFLTARGINGLLASRADDSRETDEAECAARHA
jgi:hypothetical protein